MIRNWSIRNRVLLLALLPVVSLGVVLSSYFIHSRVHDLKASQRSLGNTMANQLASASLYGVLTHNPQALHELVESNILEPDIQSLRITDNAGRVLAEVNRSMSPGHGIISQLARRIGAETGFEGSLTFTRPIVRNSVSDSTQPTAPGNARSPTPVTTLGYVTVRLSEVHFAERQAGIIVHGGLILLVCLAFSILLALIISGSVVAPIGRVINMVRRFSSGDHAVRVPEHSGGELGRLEQGINHMAANAERSQQELQDQVDQATAELRGTLEEFEIKSVELDLARKRALQASHVKSEFLANMSHEIRTPMNAVLGFSDLLTRTPLNEGQRNYLATIRQSANTLLMLLDNILNASRLEMGDSQTHTSRFVLREVLEETVQIHAMDAYAKQIELVLHSDGYDSQPLLGDQVKLKLILCNLVANSIKFTDAGTVAIRSLSTSSEAGAMRVELEISDTGIGIREQDQRQLFQPFFQVNGSADRQHGGAGLGLYITKKLVEQMAGNLTLSSALGQGSKVRVSLVFRFDDATPVENKDSEIDEIQRKPLLVYEANPQAAEALLTRLERLGWKHHLVNSLPHMHELLGGQPAQTGYAAVVLSLGYADMRDTGALEALLAVNTTSLPVLTLVSSVNAEVQAEIGRHVSGHCVPKSVSEAKLGEQLQRLTGETPHSPHPDASTHAQLLQDRAIIVADDNRINRLLERILLEKYGATVLEARTGQELVNLLAQHRVDLILLDMQMPGEDGWQVAQKLKAGQAGELSIPIIALSAMHAEKSVQELAEAGVADWLMKPLDDGALRDIIMRHLHAAGALAEDAHTPDTLNAQYPGAAIAVLRPAIRQMLSEDLPAQWQAIESAWEDRDLAQLQQHVHKLNGSAAFCRLGSLRSLCTELELHLRDGHDARIPHLITQIKAEIDGILVLLGRDAISSVAPS